MCRVVVTGTKGADLVPAELVTTTRLRADPKTKFQPLVHPAHSLQAPPCASGHLAGGHLAGVLRRPRAAAWVCGAG